MNAGALVWLIIFAVAGTGFFLIAAVVAFKGVADLRDLLRHSERVVQTQERAADQD